MKPILITSYVDADLDGVAGMIGYAEFLEKQGKNVVTGVMGEPHDEAKYMCDRFGFVIPERIINADDFDEVILVDTSDLNGVEGKVDPEKVIEIIDHRTAHEAEKFPNARVQIELVGAAATLIAERFMKDEVEISRESAILLYGAIISNTFNFKGNVTTDRDKQAAAWLNQTAQLPENFWKELFAAKSDLSGPKLAERMKGDFAQFVIGEKKVGIAQLEIIGAKKLLAERSAEILQELDTLKGISHADYLFLNIVELENDENFFVTNDATSQELLEKIIHISFNDSVAQRPGLIMRKEIVPMLKKELENKQ